MGFLSLNYNSSDFPSYIRLMSALPVMANQVLGFIGNESKKILKRELLSGQELQYRQTPGSPERFLDSAKRRKATYGIRNAQYVTIKSYPANFYTVPNSRQRKRNIWGKLKVMTNSQMDSLLKIFDRKYLQTEVESFPKHILSRQRF